MTIGTMGPTRDLGPAIVDWGATTISEIFEEVRLTPNSAEAGKVYEAISGGTPVDTIISGFSECLVTVPATRIAKATFATLLADAGTNPATVDDDTAVGISVAALTGVSMYDNGLPLFIKPIVAGVAAVNGTWMRLERTYPTINFDVVFNLRDQRVYGFTFTAHPDRSKGDMLWSAGTVWTETAYA